MSQTNIWLNICLREGHHPERNCRAVKLASFGRLSHISDGSVSENYQVPLLTDCQTNSCLHRHIPAVCRDGRNSHSCALKNHSLLKLFNDVSGCVAQFWLYFNLKCTFGFFLLQADVVCELIWKKNSAILQFYKKHIQPARFCFLQQRQDRKKVNVAKTVKSSV